MKSFVISLLVCLSASAINAVDSQDARASLHGVDALSILVDVNKNVLGLAAEDIRADVEQRCTQVGVKLTKTKDAPFLYINLNVMQVGSKGGRSAVAVAVEVSFNQRVVLQRASAISLVAPTWSVHSLVGGSSADQRYLRESVLADVDKFLSAFVEQNPTTTGLSAK